jgi:hypothetical protein
MRSRSTGASSSTRRIGGDCGAAVWPASCDRERTRARERDARPLRRQVLPIHSLQWLFVGAQVALSGHAPRRRRPPACARSTRSRA